MATAKVVLQVACPNCRTSNVYGSPYCGRCGAPLSDVPTSPVQPEVGELGQLDAQGDLLRRFLNEGQDEVLVRQIYQKASQIMTDGEEIEYIATASRSVVGSAPTCVVATNRRLIDYKKKILGRVELDDCFWRDVREVQMKEVRNGVSLLVETIQGWRLTVDSLPRAQARRLFEVGAEHNLRLQSKLQQMLEAATVANQVTPSPIEADDQPRAVPVPLQEESIATTEAVYEPTLLVEPQPVWPPSSTSIGPLPLVQPGTESGFPERWQAQSATHTEPGDSQVEADEPPPFGALDDLLSPLLGKGGHGSKRVEEPAADQPTPKPQPDPGHSNGWYAPAAPSLLVNYRPAPETLHAGATNGLNGRDALALPKSNGLLVADPLPPAQIETAPKVVETPVAPAKELYRAESATPSDAHHVETLRPTGPRESPMRKLKQLKRMMDVGLITEADYEAKKADILSRM